MPALASSINGIERIKGGFMERVIPRGLFCALGLLFGALSGPSSQEVFPQLGHTGQVTSLAFNPKAAKYLVSGAADASVKVWDTEKGLLLRTLSGHANGVTAVAYSPDGRRAASASPDGTVKVWDLETGLALYTINHLVSVLSVVYSPEGEFLFLGDGSGNISAWDAESGGLKGVGFTNLGVPVYAASRDPEGSYAVFGTGKGIVLYDAGHKSFQYLEEHDRTVRSVAFGPGGRFAAGFEDGALEIWDAKSRSRLPADLNHGAAVTGVAFKPGGGQFVSAASDKTIRVWDAETGKELRPPITGSDPAGALSYSPDGSCLVRGNPDGAIHMVDPETGGILRSLSGHAEMIWDAAFSPGGDIVSVNGSSTGLIGTDRDSTIKIWNTRDGTPRFLAGDDRGVNRVAYSPDGRIALGGAVSAGDSFERPYDPAIKIWDTGRGRALREFRPIDIPWGIAFSPDGGRIACGFDDGTIAIQDSQSGAVLHTLLGHTNTVSSLAFSPDGGRIVSGSLDGTARIWDAGGRPLRLLTGHTGNVLSVAFSPDGRRVVSGSADKTLRVWDTETGRRIRTITGHEGVVLTVRYGSGGSIISGSADGTIREWDGETFQERRKFTGTGGAPVMALGYNAERKQIVSGSHDGTVRLWSESGRELVRFVAFDDREWICVTPDGYYTASPQGDRYLNVRIGSEVYSMDKYKQIFYNPAVISAALTGDETVYLAAVKAAGGLLLRDAASFVPPMVTIRGPAGGTQFDTGTAELSVMVRDMNQPIKHIAVKINGRILSRGEIINPLGDVVQDAAGLAVRGDRKRLDNLRFQVKLQPGTNRIEVRANNGYSDDGDTVEVFWETDDMLPNLWIIAVGVNRYEDPDLGRLSYAVQDATEIVNLFKSQEGTVYRKVNDLLLVSDNQRRTATKANIVNNFSFFLRDVGDRDIVILFLSGHGTYEERDGYFFLPHDAAFTRDGSVMPSQAISYNDIRMITEGPGKRKLIFIDTCHSAAVAGKRIKGGKYYDFIRKLQDSGAMIFTSSEGNEISIERSTEGHSLFTYAIIDGMKGEADKYKDGIINMSELYAHVMNTVPSLSEGEQHPVMPVIIEDFPVAKVKK
jgi:WD40 repeat protein